MGGIEDERLGDFTLGEPALVCRWRLAGRALPMEGRHLRALARRRLAGRELSPQLVAWAKQHIEWTLTDGAARYPDGVLMLIVDEGGRAAMTVGPYEALASTTALDVASRAASAAREASVTGVAPETLWGVRDDGLVHGLPDAATGLSGADSLVADLARTVGIAVAIEGDLAERALSGCSDCDELFLASDEHGVVVASDTAGARAERFATGYARLLASVRGDPAPSA